MYPPISTPDQERLYAQRLSNTTPLVSMGALPRQMAPSSASAYPDPVTQEQPPQPIQYDTNALQQYIAALYPEREKQREDRFRKAATVNALGNILRTLFDSMGASKGAPVTPIQNKILPQYAQIMQENIARQDKQNLVQLQEALRNKQLGEQRNWEESTYQKHFAQNVENADRVRTIEDQAKDQDRQDAFNEWLIKQPIETQETIKRYNALYGPGGAKPYINPETGMPYYRPSAGTTDKTEKPLYEITGKDGKTVYKLTEKDVSDIIRVGEEMKATNYDPVYGDKKNPQKATGRAVKDRNLANIDFTDPRQVEYFIRSKYGAEAMDLIQRRQNTSTLGKPDQPGSKTLTPSDFNFPWQKNNNKDPLGIF